ncbi:MAG: hypothetical protein U0529_13570 [Thermoanaerobaculia bacterium]
MHRLLSDKDVCIAQEVHYSDTPKSMGISISTLWWNASWEKKASTVEMGSLSVHPLGIGHDSGIYRVHTMVAIPPVPSDCVLASAMTTGMSSCKPQFSAHLSQAGCGDGCFPMTAEPIPYFGAGLCSTTVCGSPFNTPAPLVTPILPMQLTVWTGMTAGDIVGGIVNIACDALVSAIQTVLGDKLGTKCPVLNLIPILGKALGINLDTGIENPGTAVQEGVDGDGVSSSARPGFRAGGWGWSGGGPAGPMTK